MNRVELVLRTPAVSLLRFDHPPGDEHRDPEREVASEESINFVEDGAFAIDLEGASHRFVPGSIFVTRRGMEFACHHDGPCPIDRCLSVGFSEPAVEDLARADVAPLRAPAAAAGPRQRYLRHRLASCAPGDELRLELIAGALFESLADASAARSRRAANGATDVLRRLDRAIERIESDFASPLTLADLAGDACWSPFHFARTFRELTGWPPHRHLAAVRLAHAARRLAAGAAVTETCFAVGFGSLSHFVTAFHRRFGVAPSAVRRGARVPALRAALRAPVARLPRPARA